MPLRNRDPHPATNASVVSINRVILPNELLRSILSYACTAALVHMKQVNRRWKELCTHAIDRKRTGRVHFHTTRELKKTIRKYVRYQWEDAEMFAVTYGFPMNNWDVSHLTDLSYVFSNRSTFNEDIRSWNVANVTNMRGIFWDAKSFNQDISSWDVSQVTNMGFAFSGATSFHQDISSWNVRRVTNMRRMFCNATNFNPHLIDWDLSNVQDTDNMFLLPFQLT